MRKEYKPDFAGSLLDTIAQTRTRMQVTKAKKPAKLLWGTGSDLSDNDALHKKGERKMITQSVVLSVIDIAKKKGNQKLVRNLWGAYRCQRELTTAEGRIYTTYCRGRVCSICCGIRKAEKIRRYLPVLQTWAKPYFVTLTAKSLPAKNLTRRMKDMNRGLRIIIERHKKKAQRASGFKLVGFKVLESNFNATKRTYNPHLHLIVENEEMAKVIVSEWLALCTKDFANPKAQHYGPVRDKEESLVELVKYSTKLLTEPNPGKKRKDGSRYVYAAALYNIMNAMQGLRIFDRFGFDLPKGTRREKQCREFEDIEHWKYSPKSKDWLNAKKQRLTGFVPSKELIDTLTNNINSELE